MAKAEWGWAPEFNLDATVDAMFAGSKLKQVFEMNNP
ncbi:MAG: hypothetical protein Ct9H90mP16_12650 [Candidatus Poseidoniales archaeon]|nr:MAG: hypothetical protein Ct9H90mP16_12650 [Candidatus Poseidoniales archaeon]